MSDFTDIKTAVARQWDLMQKSQAPMFRVDVDRDMLWAAYLGNFPPGTNPVYRERTEHDCSCCRHFVRTVGDVVAVVNGQLASVWDATPSDPAYAAVCSALSALVKSRPIAEPFVHYEPSAGTDKSFEQITGTGPVLAEPVEMVRTWTHFHVHIDRRFIKPKADIPSWLSERQSQHDVFLRSLREITPEAVETVLDLIAQGSLYRGEENVALVQHFHGFQRVFGQLTGEWAQDVFVWVNLESSASGAVARMRNTAIGTLLVDLSSGMDLEAAVRSFEAKVAPTSYKRPTALVTPAMVAKAKEKLGELGLLSALERRFATIRDLSVGNLLFVDRAARKVIQGDVFDELAAGVRDGSKNLDFDRAEEVPVDRFVTDILPRIDSLEVLFEGRHQSNLVSLVAPCDPTALPLFKWDNGFSWSYSGEVADAIRERVKKAGGNVTGDLCCRLAWWNYDDLDLHMIEPPGTPGAYEIFFGNRHCTSPSGGRLDVDMNITPHTREPVENIFYQSRAQMREGEYVLYVNQYNYREPTNPGFECEIDYLGRTWRFAYGKVVRHKENVRVARLRYTHKGGVEILESLPMTESVREVWGIKTQSWHRVQALCLSPNFWDGQLGIGNRHFFFMLEGCRNDGSARGFFNEFLRQELEPHRKTLETVGSRLKAQGEDVEGQLSGLGFSSTRRDSVVCRVKGSFTRTIKVVF